MTAQHANGGMRVLALLAFGQFIAALDYNIVYVALPEIGRALGFSEQSLQWTVSAYAVAFGGLLLFGGRAADLLGRRRMFVLAISLYGVSSLVGGLASSQELLIGARAGQGVGGALLVPATLSLIATEYAEGAARNRALAVWGGAGALGLALGALLGGVLTSAFGWESVFLVNVPLTAVAAVAGLRLLPVDGRRDRTRRLDLPGAVSGTLAVTAIVYGLVQGPELGWCSAEVLAVLGAGAALLLGFIAIERVSDHALMPLGLFRNRSLVTAMGITFVFMGTFGTQYYLFTVYLQGVLGYSALQTGMAFLPAAVLGMVGARIAESTLGSWGIRPSLIAALVTGGLGMAAFALALSEDGTFVALLPGIALISLGQGVGWTSMFAAAGAGVPPHEQGIASALASTTQQIGAAVGLGILVAVANSADQTVDGLRLAGFVAAAATVAGCLLTAGLRRHSHDDAARVEEPAVVDAAAR